MKIIIGIISLSLLLIAPAVIAQEGSAPAESPSRKVIMYGREGDEVSEEVIPPAPRGHGGNGMGGKKGRRGPGGRGRKARLQFKEFRREVRAMGSEIRENKLMIQSLEEELETMEPGVPRAEVRKKLNESRRREAELQVELARKRVDFTRKARDLAQERYDRARLRMERVKEKIRKKYPDLASQLDRE